MSDYVSSCSIMSESDNHAMSVDAMMTSNHPEISTIVVDETDCRAA